MAACSASASSIGTTTITSVDQQTRGGFASTVISTPTGLTSVDKFRSGALRAAELTGNGDVGASQPTKRSPATYGLPLILPLPNCVRQIPVQSGISADP